MLIYLTLLICLLHISMSTNNTTSCTQCWMLSKEPDIDCLSHHLCTKSNYTYKDTINTKYDFFHESSCQALQKKNITKMIFIGDSYIRHIFQGFNINLSGNYINGGTRSNNINCLNHGQFREKAYGCSNTFFNATLCNGKVKLVLNQRQNVSIDLGRLLPVHTSSPGTIVFYSVGNHPLYRGRKRYGVHNASHTTPVLYKNYCNPKIKKTNTFTNGLKNVQWISTHRRLFGYFPDESDTRIKQFNTDMKTYIQHNCPTMGDIDVYNMTDALLKTSMILNKILL